MAVYTTTSIKPIIAKIIRDTRITDMTYADDIIGWVGEALNRCMIRSRLEKTYKVLNITNHSSKLPCGLVTLSGVIYNGQRLRKGTGSIDVRIQRISSSELNSYFVTNTEIQAEDINSQNISLIRGGNITNVDSNEITSHFYDLSYDYIKTSFKEGQIIICYKTAPVDKEGYPLAPNLQELRDAVFWYVCSKLVFTGYKLPNPDMNFAFCDAQATKFFRKAKNIIKAESTDEKENQVRLRNNLIPPDNYYDTFFINGEQRKYVR